MDLAAGRIGIDGEFVCDGVAVWVEHAGEDILVSIDSRTLPDRDEKANIIDCDRRLGLVAGGGRVDLELISGGAPVRIEVSREDVIGSAATGEVAAFRYP